MKPGRVAVGFHGEWDEETAAAIARGDEGAFERLFHACAAPLEIYAERYVRDSAVAEEIVAEVFIKLWRGRETWRVRTSLKAYLYAAVRNHALNWIEHQRVVDRASELAIAEQRSPGMGEPPHPLDEQLAARELARAAAAAIERLPIRCREAFTLNRQHGLAYAEIAGVMGISIKTVELHIGRALKLLRRDLAPFF